MKYMFVSDIHGNIDAFEKILEVFEKEAADKLIILGDTSSFSDRIADNEISLKLNKIKSKVEIIRGNCDSFSFEEMLEIEMSDINLLYIGEKIVVATHGHRYKFNEELMNGKDIFIQGHTHVPVLEEMSRKNICKSRFSK